MRLLLALLCIFMLSVNGRSQDGAPFTGDLSDWARISLVSEILPDSLSRLFVVTNRPLLPDQADREYLPNEIAPFRKISYLEVAFNGEKWLVRELADFEDGMDLLDPNQDMLLMLHGHGKSFPQNIERAWRVQNRYEVSVILFDWPSQNGNFNKSLSRVRRCGENFYNLLVNIRDYRRQHPENQARFNIIAHSLGNYFLTHMVVNGNWQYFDETFADHVILNAPAVRSREHGKFLSLLNISHHKYVMLNKNDKILRGARILMSGKMLGNLVMEPHATNTTYIHFTEIAGTEHNYFAGYHAFEAEDQATYNLYNQLVHGLDPSLTPPAFSPIKANEYMIHAH